MGKAFFSIGLWLLVAGVAACGGPDGRTKTLRVGFVPAEDAQQVMQNAQPIVEILRQRLGMEIQPFVATDYTGVVEALRVHKLDVAFLAPASYVLAKNEADIKVILKSERKGIPFYYAAIITRADSGIEKLDDLRGKTFAFGDALSTTGNVFPRKMFREHGIEPVRDFRQILYSGGHDATVLAVLNGKVDAGATYANSPDSQDTAWMRYLKNPADVKLIRAIAFSEPIPAESKCCANSIKSTASFVPATKTTTRCARLSSTPAYPSKIRCRKNPRDSSRDQRSPSVL